MCGRYNLRLTNREMQVFFDLFREPEWSPRYNIAPTQTVIAIRKQDEGWSADRLRWGLVPFWAKDLSIGSRMINARSETVDTSKAFRPALKARRCIIPASGFYEWEKLDKKNKQPWHIFPKSDPVFAFAGLWESWTSPEGTPVETCTIITTEANDFMARMHDRMPVVLSRVATDAWLDPSTTIGAAKSLCVPCDNDLMDRNAVSTLVNNVRNESPDCINSL